MDYPLSSLFKGVPLSSFSRSILKNLTGRAKYCANLINKIQTKPDTGWVYLLSITYRIRTTLNEEPLPKVNKVSKTSAENVGDLRSKRIFMRPSRSTRKNDRALRTHKGVHALVQSGVRKEFRCHFRPHHCQQCWQKFMKRSRKT